MKRSVLKFEAFADHPSANSFRTKFKTKHGREIFLAIFIQDTSCTITRCFYTDRNQSRTGDERFKSQPLMLKSFQFPADEILQIIDAELDKKFYDVEFVHSETSNLSLEEFLQEKKKKEDFKYHFLIMVGEGEAYNGLPVRMHTRLKNKLHRSIYIDLEYYKDGQGVVKQCCFYDRKYQRQGVTVTPPMLISCFFPYTREGIINILNNEICCNFTHMIITDGIDIDSDLTPLCGAI